LNFGLIKKRLIISLLLGVVVVVALGLYSDFSKLAASVLSFDFRYLPLILMLAPLNYLFRYVKWNYYLKLLNITIEPGDNLRIFTAGLSMTVTPGKVGEFLKSYLIKEIKGIPISVTSPLVVIERLTDGISMIILASIGALKFRYGTGILAVSAVLVVLFVASVRYKMIAHAVIGFLKRLPLLGRIGRQMDAFYQSSYELLNMKSVILSVVIGIVSWGFEGIVIFLALTAFGSPISLLSSVFIVSFSSIAGAVSMLPGGIFVAEGSIMGLLVAMGVPKGIASAATIVTRFSTLWLGVAIGIAGLLLVQRRLGFSSGDKAESAG
jgi:uncharacterized protein (TIRG00374 family)